ncbi:hypothetical protein BH23ACT9_BH23ACT9_21980 [soil metagenome]
MARTATTEQVAAALHVGPAAVRKYARDRRLPFDTTPGGHRRFDVDEAVAAIRGQLPTPSAEQSSDSELADPVPYAWVEPDSEIVATSVVTTVDDTEVRIYDTARAIGDWTTRRSATSSSPGCCPGKPSLPHSSRLGTPA